MKKILVLLLGLLLFSTSCKKEDEPMLMPSIVGEWKPVKMVETKVKTTDILSETKAYYYDDCQQQSRFIFNEDLSGHVLLKDTYGGADCLVVKDEPLDYIYDNKTGKIVLHYVTLEDEGKVSEVTENSMNLQIEEKDDDVFISKTYTLERVQ
ncbi:MAG: hypothetical protein CSA38_03395 [Flavobacteriales bacterium]|nr:MAG: hypothetical protein CSA38_03395 [Flavobacteriales bacterium]